jgi:hypothetical protein
MPTSYALITTSCRHDVEHCARLMESVDRWIPPDVRHYLVVDRSDVPAFRRMLRPRAELIVAEDILPRWLFRAPGLRRLWLSRRTLPVGSWTLQQIIKLSVACAVPEDVLLHAEPGMCFVRHHDPRRFERGGRVPLLVETVQCGLIPRNDEWHRVAARLMGLPVERSYDTSYISPLVWWRRRTAQAALRRMEKVEQREWALTIASLIRSFSACTFYGVYVDYLEGAQRAGHWRPTPLDRGRLEAFECSGWRHPPAGVPSRSALADIRSVFFG